MGLAGGLRILQTVSCCPLTLHEIMVSARACLAAGACLQRAHAPAIRYLQAVTRACGAGGASMQRSIRTIQN